MKRRIFALIATVAIFAVNPVFAMDEPAENITPTTVLKKTADGSLGTLVLEAELSEEQRAAVVKKFVEPYKEYKKKNGERFLEQGIWLRYPHLIPLKTMKYTTELAFPINKDEANTLATAYINAAKILSLNQIRTSPGSIGTNYDKVDERSSRDHPDEITSTHGEAVYISIETTLSSNPEDLCSLKRHVIKKSPDTDIKGLADKSNSFGSISYGSTGFFKGVDERQWLALNEMNKKIRQLSCQSDPLTVSFNTFTLKYIDDEGHVGFSHPLDLQ